MFSAEATAAEPTTVTAAKAFSLTDISTIVLPHARPLVPVTLRLTSSCLCQFCKNYDKRKFVIIS